MVDRAVVNRLLIQLDEYIRDLEAVRAQYTLLDFRANKVIRRYTERTLQIAIEACLDLASHVISLKGFREPIDNKDCFEVLLENKLLPVELVQRLKLMAQFRNVVVHDYIRINPDIVYSIVHENIADMVTFAQIIDALS